MLFLIRPVHRWARKYDIKHHHILFVWAALCFLVPAVTIFTTLGTTFSTTAQALSVFIMGTSIGVFFYILLLAEESRVSDAERQETGEEKDESPTH